MEPSRRVLGALAALLALPALTGCVAVPDLDEALAGADRVAQTTKVYAADGSLITQLHAEINRELIPLAKVPVHVRDAVLAIEDARFYNHPGLDYYAILRALTRNAREGRIVEGASTITQQLVKNTLAGNERTYERKIREAVLAFQLEQRFTKDEILERYLNTVYFGRGAYGVEAAAKTYFSKRARKLTLAEGAMLAGLIRSPSRYDPSDPKTTKARRNLVLRRMLEEGMINSGQHRAGRLAKLGLDPLEEDGRYPYPYFVDYVKDRIFNGGKEFAALGRTREERVNAVFKGGLRIYTTLDRDLQRTAEQAVRTALPYGSDPYGAFVAMRPSDGAIAAMVGGRNFFKRNDPYAKFNLAVRGRRQPGSTFKPFTLVAALENGIPLTRVYRGGSRITLRTQNGEIWPVGNYSGKYFPAMNLKQATAFSVNVVYAQAVLEVGPEKVVDVARRMGITSPLKPYASITLGAFEVSPLELARAYATLANAGRKIRPTPISRITDAQGTVLYEAVPEPKQVISPTVASLATEALQEVMRTGTGRARNVSGWPSAGKTGTSENYYDAWFAGYTTNMVGVAWVGFPRAQIPMRPPNTRITVFGGSWPGQIWQTVMNAAHSGSSAQDFPVADELLVKVRVDVSRDCLPNEFTPPYLIKEKSYIEGSEPTKVCTEPTTGDIPATPDVTGLDAPEARSMLSRAGFAVSQASKECPAFAAGMVCDQNPRPGAPSVVGTRATIFVSTGTPSGSVPSAIGRSLSRATAKLEAAGYRVRGVLASVSDGVECADLGEERSGRVWGQSPCPGTTLSRGSTVTVYVNG